MELIAHSFSSYCWKVMIAFHEKDVPYTLRHLDAEHPENAAALKQAGPLGKMPLLIDDGQPVFESSIIIEHLDQRHPAPPMIPADAAMALEVRLLDRVFDNYLQGSFQTVVTDAIGGGRGDSPFVASARKALLQTYAWLDARLAGRTWAAGDSFTLADCAAAPALFYADWTEAIPAEHEKLWAYRRRLLARPSVVRCVEAARPYRHFFPLGAPDRD